MASGTAVVSTTIDGIPELVANDETGFLAPPKDARALAEAVITLIGNGNAELRERFGRAGRARIEQRFTIEKTIEPLVEQFMMIEQRTQQR
jgi:glycosyltransferase involved in cell wall biosynthesis